MLIWIKKNPILIFYILTFTISWGIWIPLALGKAGLIKFLVPETLAGLLGAWTPSLLGIFVTAIFFDGNAVKALLIRLTMWRVGYFWYFAAILFPIIISLLTTCFATLFGYTIPDFSHPPITQTTVIPPEILQAGFLVLLPFIFLSQFFGSSLGEEIGWRGFALSGLQSRFSPLIASLILGILWGIWHFPRIWIPGETFDLMGFIWLILGTTLSSIVYTWIYNATKGSLVPILFLHTSQALSNLFLARADAPLFEFIITTILVTLLVWRVPELRKLTTHK